MLTEKPPHEFSDKILNSITDGVFTVDNELNITFFNRSAEKITGISRAEAMGEKCFDVFLANICQSTCPIRKSIQSGIDVVNLFARGLQADVPEPCVAELGVIAAVAQHAVDRHTD